MESKLYWNLRYSQGGNSGYGSYGEQLEKKLKWLKPFHVKKICEIGCGDFNFGKNLIPLLGAEKYEGYDISEQIIAINKENFPYYTWGVYDKPVTTDADMLLCVDVLLHVMDDKDYEQLLDNLEKAWNKYLVITAYEYDGIKNDHLNIRNFDYKRFGEPIIREIVEEDGSLYFYLFEK